MNNIKVIAHRGANIYAPQNTMPAFEKAIELGVDGFETDIHMTRDGVPVICHNYSVDETSNGHGRISEMFLDDLKKLDFGYYFSPKFKGTQIPTLDEFLSFIEKTDISVLNIELKSPKDNENGMVASVIEKVKDHGLFDRLIISSFNPDLLVEAKELDAACKTGFLYSPEKQYTYKHKMLSKPVAFAKSISADALHPMYNYVSEKYVYNAHEAGIEVNVWTINSVRMIENMIRYGVDGIITNFPDVTRGVIEKYK